MGERKRDGSRLPAPPQRRHRALRRGEGQRGQSDGSPAEDGEPGAQARMPHDVTVVLDELRAAAEAHDNDLKYSFLEAS